MLYALKDVAVFFNAEPEGLHALEAAAKLASKHQALLIGICVLATDRRRTHDAYARGSALKDVIEQRKNASMSSVLQAGKALQQVAQRHNLDVEFRVIPYTESHQDLSMHSLHSDLLVVHKQLPDGLLSWSAEAVLKRTGVPLLLVPQDWQHHTIGRHILLGWNGSREARRAIADAMPLLVSADQVDLLIVDPEQTAKLTSEEPGMEMAAYLARRGVKVELIRVLSEGRSIAETILHQASQSEADLVVIGAYGRSRLSETLFGGVTRRLIDSIKQPLFMSH